MRCPKCKNEIDIGAQVVEADKAFYEGVEPPILLMIDCPSCEAQVAAITIDGVEGFDTVQSLLGDVQVPRI